MSARWSVRHRLTAVLAAAVWIGLATALPGAWGQVAGSKMDQQREMDSVLPPQDSAAEYMRATPLQRSAAMSRELKEIRIAQQFGLGYLPLTVARQYGMIEKHASAAGLGHVTVRWSRLPSGKSMNDALQAGFLDIAAGGVAPLLEAWDKTLGGRDVKGIMSLSSMPLYLNTTNPRVRNLADFTAEDRIALPAVKVSLQAVILQMSASRTFGSDQANRLDGITRSMSHPRAMEALLTGRTGITAHFASPPYQGQELRDPRVRMVLSSNTVLGGPSSFSALWASSRFYENNPRTFAAVFNAVLEAMRFIPTRPGIAAKAYTIQATEEVSADQIERAIRDPENRYDPIPRNVMKIASFMHREGALQHLPADWRDVFFAAVHGEDGS
jgi:NitT/TauT family transport system substrate-binding protein